MKLSARNNAREIHCSLKLTVEALDPQHVGLVQAIESFVKAEDMGLLAWHDEAGRLGEVDFLMQDTV